MMASRARRMTSSLITNHGDTEGTEAKNETPCSSCLRGSYSLAPVARVIDQEHLFGFFGFRDGLPIEHALQPFDVELIVRLGDDNRREPVADQVCERARA